MLIARITPLGRTPLMHGYSYTPIRAVAASIALCVGLLVVSGCSDDPDDSEGTEPLPPAETTSTTPSTEPPSTEPTTPATTEPAWQDKYGPDELAAYEEALDRFTTYEQRSEPIYRRGKATPAAEQLFQEYFSTWRGQFIRLQSYEQADAQIHGIPEVLSSQATRIVVEPSGASVTIRQCVDYAPVRTFQDGERAPSVDDKTRPRDIVLSRSLNPEETPWLITAITLMDGTTKC